MSEQYDATESSVRSWRRGQRPRGPQQNAAVQALGRKVLKGGLINLQRQIVTMAPDFRVILHSAWVWPGVVYGTQNSLRAVAQHASQEEKRQLPDSMEEWLAETLAHDVDGKMSEKLPTKLNDERICDISVAQSRRGTAPSIVRAVITDPERQLEKEMRVATDVVCAHDTITAEKRVRTLLSDEGISIPILKLMPGSVGGFHELIQSIEPDSFELSLGAVALYPSL